MSAHTLELQLAATEDQAYDRDYNYRTRGRIWQTLVPNGFRELHDSNGPSGISFSNPFPVSDMAAGDTRYLRISSAIGPDPLEVLEDEFITNPRLEAGDMNFLVTDTTIDAADPGPPGTTGEITTGTGIVMKLSPAEIETYDIENPYETEWMYWRGDEPLAAFVTSLEKSLDGIIARLDLDITPPTETPPLFDSYDLMKTFGDRKTIKHDYREYMIGSQWSFGYTVRDETHRDQLRTLLGAGVGARTSYGMGHCYL